MDTNIGHRTFFNPAQERLRARNIGRLEEAGAFGSPYELTRDEAQAADRGELVYMASDDVGSEHNAVRAWLERN